MTECFVCGNAEGALVAIGLDENHAQYICKHGHINGDEPGTWGSMMAQVWKDFKIDFGGEDEKSLELEQNKTLKALALWKRWFEYSGDLYERHDPWFRSCFFCGEEEPNHEPDCVYVAAKELVEGNESSTVREAKERMAGRIKQYPRLITTCPRCNKPIAFPSGIDMITCFYLNCGLTFSREAVYE